MSCSCRIGLIKGYGASAEWFYTLSDQTMAMLAGAEEGIRSEPLAVWLSQRVRISVTTDARFGAEQLRNAIWWATGGEWCRKKR